MPKSTDSVLDPFLKKSQYFIDCSIQVVKKENKNTESSYLNIQTVINENEKINKCWYKNFILTISKMTNLQRFVD